MAARLSVRAWRLSGEAGGNGPRVRSAQAKDNSKSQVGSIKMTGIHLSAIHPGCGSG